MPKPTNVSRIAAVISFVAVVGLTILVCLCPEIFLVIFLMATAFGLFIGGLVSIASSPPPSRATPPAREANALTALIVGLALGWWLGGGPGDGGSGEDC